MNKFTVSVITIIDKYQDKLPYLYESLIANTDSGINIFWNIYCNEEDLFASEILKNFTDLPESRNGGFLKIKIIYGNLNRFDAEDECLKHSFGDVVVNAYPDAVFIQDAFKKVQENIFFLKDIYGFAFLEKNMKEYLRPNENIKILDLMLNEEKFNVPIFFNLNIRKKVKNNLRSINDDIPREVPNLSYLDLDKYGYIFALNIPIVQSTQELEENNQEEDLDEEDLIKRNISKSPKIFKIFYENIFKLGRKYFRKHNINLKKHISRYIYSLYILHQGPNLNKIEDKILKLNIRFKYLIQNIIYKIKNRNTEDRKEKDKNIQKRKLKERYLMLLAKDKPEIKEQGITKLASLSRGEKINTYLSNIDFETLNKNPRIENEPEEIKEAEKEEKIDTNKTIKVDIKEDKKDNTDIDEEQKTKAFDFKELNLSSDYKNYIKNMNDLKNDQYKVEEKTTIIDLTKTQEKEINEPEDLNINNKTDSSLNFDLILEKTLVTKKLSNIKEKRETQLTDKIVYSDVSKNTVEQNLEILKELEKEEKRLIEEKERLKKEKEQEKENKRINAWNNYISSHYKEREKENKDIETEKIEITNQKNETNKTDKAKDENKIEDKNTSKYNKKRTLTALNEDGSVKILDNLEDKKQKYLQMAKSKKQQTDQVEDYLFGDEFN